MAYAVEAHKLTKRYKNFLAVDNIDIAIPEGCCCGFLGKNGAGKTTTIKMLVGIKRPTSGSISIMGKVQKFGALVQIPFGYLPDVPNFYGYMNGMEFLDLCGKLCGIPTIKRKAKVNELLKQVGLDKVRTRISGYSRGMKQRLGIAQAMINDPKVIFMDEPVSALDPIGRRDVVEIIESLKNTTVIFSTHILADVENLCDFVLIIEKGKIMAQESMTSLKEKHSAKTAKVCFYRPQDAENFMSHAAKFKQFSTDTRGNNLELLLHSKTGNMEELSLLVAGISHTNNIAIDNFAAHTPHLEDIFYDVIGK